MFIDTGPQLFAYPRSVFVFGRVTVTFFHVALLKILLLGASKDEESSVFPWFLFTVFNMFLFWASPRCLCRGDGQYFLLSWNILAGRQEVWPLVDLDC